MGSGKNSKLNEFLATQLKLTSNTPFGELLKTEFIAIDPRHQGGFDV
jgi:hypothetical protein